MKNGIYANNFTLEGNPTGGCVSGLGFGIVWQDGPLGPPENRTDPNGAFVEDVIDACRQRLVFYQRSPFRCPENEEAIRHLNSAMEALERRTSRRVAEGTEGLHRV